MKKNIILKIFIYIVFTTTSLFSASLSSTEIVNMVAEIKKERIGITLSQLENTGKPFLIRIPRKKELKEVKEIVEVKDIVEVFARVEVVYTLKAILNKAAFIDTKWYKQGDSIGDYKIGHVSLNSVVLKGKSSNKTLSLEKKKKNFIKSTRGYK